MTNKYERRNPFSILRLMIIDLLCSLIRYFTNHNKDFEIPHPQNILIAHPGHLGDFVMLTAQFKKLKETYPNAKIIVMCGSWANMALKPCQYVDDIINIDHWKTDRANISKFQKIRRYILDARNFLKEHKKWNIDIAYSPFTFEPSLIPLLWLAKIPVRIGFTSAGYGPLLTHAVDLNQINVKHEIEIQNFPLYYFGLIPDLDLTIDLAYSLDETAIQKSLLSKHIQLPSTFVVLHPGSGGEYKEWRKEKWLELIEKLTTSNLSIVVTGQGERDAKFTEYLSQHSSVEFLNLVNRVNWIEFIYTVQQASLIISVDSVISHLAAAYNKPHIGIYTGIAPIEQWKPISSNSHILTHPMPCSPCKTRYCDERPCINEVRPQHVIEQMKQFSIKIID